MWEVNRNCVVLQSGTPKTVRVRITKSAWSQAGVEARKTAKKMLSRLEIPVVQKWETGLKFNIKQHRWVLDTGGGHQFETTTYDRDDCVEVDFAYFR